MNVRGSVGVIGSLLLAPVAQAQGWLPVSSTVERPYAPLMHRFHHHLPEGLRLLHTSVHPYLRDDLAVLPGADTLAPAPLLPLLGRWAGDSTTSLLRGGPLVDAEAGVQNEGDEAMTHRAGVGFWLESDPGERWALHLDGEVFSEAFPDHLDTIAEATLISLGEGQLDGEGPYTHYNWSGYVDYTAGKYFHLTLGRGRHFFGEGYRSLFLSDNASGYPYFKITTTAWHIRYVNLFTMLNDVRWAQRDPTKYLRKYASFHYLSWNVSRRVNIGVFEGIIWEDNDPDYPRGFDVNYLNPVILYRPVEYSLGSPDNAVLGFSLNVKVGRNTQLYSQVLLDEFLLSEVRAGNGWYANKQAFQLGLNAFEAFQVPGLRVRTEFNYVRPFMYSHSDTRQNYAHFGQPLAHPYGANFWELIGQVEYTQDRWTGRLHMNYAMLGSDTGAYSYGNNIFRPWDQREPRDANHLQNYGYYVGDQAALNIFYGECGASYLVDPHAGLSLEATYTFRSHMPAGSDNTIEHWFRVGIVTHLHERQLDQEVRYALP